MFDRCPGTARIRTPTLEVRACPQCGAEVETFSNDRVVSCGECGCQVYNDLQSCVKWCRYARECVGEEMYRRLVGDGDTGP
jgi:protein-arginine kinase activator protein McsA